MKKIFLVLALTIYSGSMISSAIAATNGVNVVLNDDDKKKKKKKKSCCSSTEAKTCPAKTEGKSCCSSKKN
jgi:hypothetical protein